MQTTTSINASQVSSKKNSHVVLKPVKLSSCAEECSVKKTTVKYNRGERAVQERGSSRM